MTENSQTAPQESTAPGTSAKADLGKRFIAGIIDAAIAAVVGRRAGQEWRSGEILQFMVLIRTSVIVLFLSFAPAVLSHLVSSEDIIWRISSGMLGLALLIDVSWFVYRSKQVSITFVQRALVTTGFIIVAGLFASSAGLIRPFGLAFLVGLLFLLFVAVYNFVLLLVKGTQVERHKS